MSDLICRQTAINILCSKCTVDKPETCSTIQKGDNWCPEVYILQRVPSAQPEQKWIPCSERLPKPGYCITSNEYNGVSEDFYYDDHFWNADKNAYEVIAWMPLPEPYKKGDTT